MLLNLLSYVEASYVSQSKHIIGLCHAFRCRQFPFMFFRYCNPKPRWFDWL